MSIQLLTIDEGSTGQRIDNYLLRILKGVPKSRIYRIVRKGEVRVNGGRIKVDYRLQNGDVVRVPPVRVSERTPLTPNQQTLQRLQQAIIFEDSRYLVLNKPSGVAVHGGSGVSYGVIEGLRALRPEAPYLELAHRLDRETSGCLIVAKKRSALRSLQMLLEAHQVDKSYLALVSGEWRAKRQKVVMRLQKNQLQSGERLVKVAEGGKEAVSYFATEQLLQGASLMRVDLETGRTHQIRVHCQQQGHPIAGDDKYGDAAFNRTMQQHGLQRLFLHAESISFTLPDEQTYFFEAPLDDSMLTLLQRLQPHG